MAACATDSIASGIDRAIALMDLRGNARTPLAVTAETSAAVLVFVTTDCPIANAYAPEISAIAREYEQRGFEFFVVHVDPDVSADDARRHAGEYALDEESVILDPEHDLVRALGITITPEVAVVRSDASIAYRGRIDDQWADFGKKRRAARKQDLRAALDAILGGRSVGETRTMAVGCSIPIIAER